MTKEEALKVFRSREIFDLMNYYTTDELQEMIDEIVSTPSIPSNLDEAAHKHAANNGGRWLTDDIGIKCFAFNPQEVKDAFKAGAEWMAKQSIAGNSKTDCINQL